MVVRGSKPSSNPKKIEMRNRARAACRLSFVSITTNSPIPVTRTTIIIKIDIHPPEEYDLQGSSAELSQGSTNHVY
jgi:hypothetical protein